MSRGLAELFLEHHSEGARAVITELRGHLDDLVTAGDHFQRQQQPELLAPLAEGQPGVLLEQSLDRPFIDAQLQAPVSSYRPGEQ